MSSCQSYLKFQNNQNLFIMVDEGVPGLVGEEEGGRQEVLIHTVAHQVRHTPYKNA